MLDLICVGPRAFVIPDLIFGGLVVSFEDAGFWDAFA